MTEPIPVRNKMLIQQVISIIFILAISTGTFGKAIVNHDLVYVESRVHVNGRNRRQIGTRYAGRVPAHMPDYPASAEHSFPSMEDEVRTLVANQEYGSVEMKHSSAGLQSGFANHFIMRGMQVAGTSTVHGTRVHSGSYEGSNIQYPAQNVRLPEILKPYEYKTRDMENSETRRESAYEVRPPPAYWTPADYNTPTPPPTPEDSIETTRPSAVAPTNIGINNMPKTNPDEKVKQVDEDGILEVPCFCAVGGKEVKSAVDKGMQLKEIKTVKIERGINIAAVDKTPPRQEASMKEIVLEGECTCEFIHTNTHDEGGNKSVSNLRKNNGRKK